MKDLPVHPFTGLTALDVLPSGRIVWPVRGGSDDNPPDADPGTDPPADPPADDWQAKFAGQQKVNRDLEARSRKDLKTIEKLTADLEKLRQGSAPAEEVESLLADARKQAAEEATSAANARIVRAEVKAAATGLFADPADAVAFLDLTAFNVDDEGEVDGKAVRAALDELLKKKPHLAAQGRRWAGNGDQGPRETAPANVPAGIPRLMHAYANSPQKP